MRKDKSEHAFLPTLKSYLADGKIHRRQFLREATLLGLSSAAAYAFAGKISGGSLVDPALAQTSMPKGGRVRVANRVFDVKDPHVAVSTAASNVYRQVLDFLAVTDWDNVTRPALLEKWEASPDLKTWTLSVRKNVKWHKGRDFTADDVIWNFNRVLDPKTGSSMLGLMRSYMLTETETGEKDDKGNPKKVSKLWDAQAIQKIDSHTVRLNCKSAQLAIPEHLFHYPFAMLDPTESEFKAGANGTGAFELAELEVGKKAVFKARKDYWGGGPYLDTLEFIDLGDDASAVVAALASKQVDGLYQASNEIVPVVKTLPHVQVYQVVSAQTGVARGRVNVKPFDDKRVRQALRLAIDPQKIVDVTLREFGAPAEHHHVGPMHPDYAPIPSSKQDIAKAKQLLTDAGYPNGLDLEISCRKDPSWEPLTVQALVEQWKAAGVRVKINIMPATEYNKVWTEVPFGYIGWAHRPLGFMTLGLAYRTGVPWNESAYSNAEFDKILTEAEGTLDIEKRKALIAKLEAIMLDDGPITQPMWNKLNVAYDKRVKGVHAHPSIYIFGHRLAIEA